MNKPDHYYYHYHCLSSELMMLVTMVRVCECVLATVPYLVSQHQHYVGVHVELVQLHDELLLLLEPLVLGVGAEGHDPVLAEPYEGGLNTQG